MMPSVRVTRRRASTRLGVGGIEDLQAPGSVERRELGPDARVVEAGGDRVRLDDLAVPVLEQVRARAVQDAGRAAGQGRGMVAGRDPLPGRLDADQAHVRLADEPAQQADGVGAAADAGHGQVRQPALDPAELGGGVVADDALEVAHHPRVGVRPDGRAQDVVGRTRRW